MAYTRNQSVLRFKQDMQDLQQHMTRSLDQRFSAMADELIGDIREAAPKRTGTLAASIHKKKLVERIGDLERVAYLIIGGGKLTTKHSDAGVSYDYAVGTEFGTQKEVAEPFFFRTARRYFNDVQGSVLETVDQTIQYQNDARALRAENASWGADFGSDASVERGGRGHQVTIKGPQL